MLQASSVLQASNEQSLTCVPLKNAHCPQCAAT